MLDAASLAFGQVGYAGASVADVADRLGVSKALILAYFGSKDALYAACVARAAANLVPGIEAAISPPRPAPEMAQATLAAIFTALEARPSDWNLIHDRSVPHGTSGAEQAKRLRVTIADQATRGVRAVSSSADVRDEDDTEILTEIWMGAVTAVVDWWLRHPGRSAEEMIERCQRLVYSVM